MRDHFFLKKQKPKKQVPLNEWKGNDGITVSFCTFQKLMKIINIGHAIDELLKIHRDAFFASHAFWEAHTTAYRGILPKRIKLKSDRASTNLQREQHILLLNDTKGMVLLPIISPVTFKGEINWWGKLKGKHTGERH